MTDGESRPVRATVKGRVRRDGRFLLLQQDATGDGEYVWVLPGGGVEHGETFENALTREIREETSLDVDVRDVVGAYTFQFPASRGDETVHACATVFDCVAPEGEADWADEPEDEPIVDARWVTADEAATLPLGFDTELLR
ncbi:NUDIX domain-containing protein [Halospeciosus flavus]|uniref:NUDIX domain-containing protein n=1 Tax=Halospeciosus flavus TaxID=3032283 RepID=A0ABD5Z7M4_9EURY|nr:NUDIX hydrolase [Halospeciosus flavus]